MAFNESLGNAVINIRAKTDKLRADISAATNKVKRAGNEMATSMKTSSASMVSSLQRVRVAALGIGLAIAAVGRSVVTASAQIETMRVAFESALGSASAANQLLNELKQFSATTPFQLENIGRAARQLLAAGIAADQVREKLKILGDISAGANVPLGEMASIFAKIENKGKAMTEELLQLSDRGVPVLRVLAEQLGVTKEEVFELASQGKITKEIMLEAFESMTQEGGIFFNQMEKQSTTLAGKWSTLKDNTMLLAAAIGDFLAPAAKAFLDIMNSIISATTRAIGAVKSFFSVSQEVAAPTKERSAMIEALTGRKLSDSPSAAPGTPGSAPSGSPKAITNPQPPASSPIKKNVERATIKGIEAASDADQTFVPLQDSVKESVSSGITSAMQSGSVKSALENFGNGLLNIVQSRLSQTIANELFGGNGGGGFGGLINQGLGSVFGGIFGARAMGGSVGANKPYLVGERGPELFVPQGRGAIQPNNSSGGGIQITMNNNFAGVDSVNRSTLKNALKQQEQQIMSGIQKKSRSGGSFARNLRGE